MCRVGSLPARDAPSRLPHAREVAAAPARERRALPPAVSARRGGERDARRAVVRAALRNRRQRPRAAGEAADGGAHRLEVAHRGEALRLGARERREHLEQLDDVVVVAEVRGGVGGLAADGARPQVEVLGLGAEAVVERLQRGGEVGCVRDAWRDVRFD